MLNKDLYQVQCAPFYQLSPYNYEYCSGLFVWLTVGCTLVLVMVPNWNVTKTEKTK